MLKRIFTPNNQKQEEILFGAELDGLLLDSERFLARLREERLRSERYGTPLSLVTIDMQGLADFLVKTNGRLLKGFMKHLAQRLTAELNVPVSQVNPFGGLTINPKQLGDLEPFSLQAPIALGLAMRRVDDK